MLENEGAYCRRILCLALVWLPSVVQWRKHAKHLNSFQLVIILGYRRNGLRDQALKCFEQMIDTDVCPQVVMYMCCLKACGIVGSLEIGKGIDLDVRKQDLLQINVILRNTLVDMYANWGELAKAQEMYSKRGLFETLQT